MKRVDRNGRPLCFLHIGDTHLTEAGQDNHSDLQRIIAEANTHLAGQVDFAVLPGDVAEDGTPAQFMMAAEALSHLAMPWRAIPGDHDFKSRSLDAFFGTLGARLLPFAETVAGCRCLYLDIVSAGTGGPDFRIDDVTMQWLHRECNAMSASGQPGVVFMHAYPEDLGAQAASVADLLGSSPVVLVDTGHTHYNELRHDGRTVYAATRSVGQVEEGPVGYALACVDDGAVSWTFKPLGSPWPLVLITHPADRRLMLAPPSAVLRAVVFGASAATQVMYRLGEKPWQPMQAITQGVFNAQVAWPDEPVTVQVRAIDASSREGQDEIEVAPPSSRARDSFKGSVGVWASRHLLDTRLGPNCNGRKW